MGLESCRGRRRSNKQKEGRGFYHCSWQAGLVRFRAAQSPSAWSCSPSGVAANAWIWSPALTRFINDAFCSGVSDESWIWE